MKTNIFKKVNKSIASELIVMNNDELKSIQGGGSYELVQREDGTWVFRIIMRS